MTRVSRFGLSLLLAVSLESGVGGAPPLAVPITEGHSDAASAVPQPLPYEKILPGPISDYRLLTVTATAISEYQIVAVPLTAQGWHFVQEQGRGVIKPWLAVANQRTGRGIVLALAYEGNWKAEILPFGDRTVLRVNTSPGGVPVFDRLPGGLSVPGVLVSEFTGGLDYGAQPIVHFVRAHLLRDLGPEWPWVQYNDYYATVGKPTAAVMLENARIAATLGVELFTIDAGWFGQGSEAVVARTLGDWDVNRARFPQGVRPVADEVHRLGMRFGIWIEIERASPGSRLAREHPDWFLTDGHGQRLSPYGVLDFGRPEVVAHAESVIDRIVSEFDLDYLKMDFNVNLPLKSEGFSPAHDPIACHVRGLNQLRRHIREHHPKLVVESCCSGSMREDVSVAALTDTHWLSDKKVHASNGPNLAQGSVATYIFPPEMDTHFITDFDRDPTAMDQAACFNAVLQGQPGLCLSLPTLDAPTRALARERFAFFKTIRPILRQADVYHLTQPPEFQSPHAFAAVFYLDPKTQRGVLYAFNGGDAQLKHQVRLRGLMPGRQYRLELPSEFGGSVEATGEKFEREGVRLDFQRSGQSLIAKLEAW